MSTTKKDLEQARELLRQDADFSRHEEETTATKPMGVNLDEPIGVAEAARYAHVSEETVREALATGAMRGRNIGGSVGWRTTRRDVAEWVRGGNLQRPRKRVRK